MTTDIYARLVPAPESLARFASRALQSLRRESAAVAADYAAWPVAPIVQQGADAYADLASGVATSEDEETQHFDALLDELWQTTRGRDQHEQLLSIFLNAGLLEDVFRHLAKGHGDAASATVESLLGWEDAQGKLVDALKALFDADHQLDDRLAMWGRRIVGDAVVWARRIVGIEPGHPATDVHEEATPIEDAYLSELFAQHSRRMNALALAA